MAIRFILTVFSSARDRCGNCEHFAQIRSTKTGRAFAWHSHSESNLQSELRAALGVTRLDWSTLHYSTQTLGIREHARYAKQLEAGYTNPTGATITELEKE